MKIFSALLYVVAAGFVASAISGQWELDFSDRGPGWIALDSAIALGCAAVAFALWRYANRGKQPWWRRVASSWQNDHALHVFVTTGRLLGLSGAILLAIAVTTAHRWSQLPENWGRALPFGILGLVFVGAGTSPAVRRFVLPCLGVVAAIVISLPFGSSAHGAWDLTGAAISLLAFGGIMLAWSLEEVTAAKVHTISAKVYPLTLIGVSYGLLWLIFVHSAAFQLVGWWAIGVVASGMLATILEIGVFTRLMNWSAMRHTRAAVPAETTATASEGSLAPGQEP